MKDLQVFAFGNNLVRTTTRDGEPWWVARDVCAVLGLENSRKATAELDDDEKDVTICNTPGGPQEMTTVSESGLYSLIFRSRKPEAKAFRRWVTHEVLPAIRRTGGYMPAAALNRLISEYGERMDKRSIGRLVLMAAQEMTGRKAPSLSMEGPQVELWKGDVQAFLDSGWVTVDESARLERCVFCTAFRSWLKEQGKKLLPSNTVITQCMKALRMPEAPKYGGRRMWAGLRLADVEVR